MKIFENRSIKGNARKTTIEICFTSL